MNRQREQAFTLVELVVVMLITGILAALVTPRFLHARSNARSSKAEVVARIYSGVIIDFAIGTDGRMPISGNASDWPAPLERGPANRLASRTGQRFLERAPEHVQDGTVVFRSAATIPASTKVPTVTYRRASNLTYILAVTDARGVRCAITNDDALLPSTNTRIC